MRTVIPDEFTPLTLEQAIEAFAAAHVRTMGLEPSAGTLAAIVAHSALETGYWKSMHCYDFGNEKAPGDWDECVCTFRCDETFDEETAKRCRELGVCVLQPQPNGKVHVVLPAGHPWAYFKAFWSAADGAFEQLQLLIRDRYRVAWRFFCDGNAFGAALALGQADYYTAPNQDAYARAVTSIAAKILPACAAYLSGEGHSTTDEMRAYVEALVFKTLDENRETDTPEPAPEVA